MWELGSIEWLTYYSWPFMDTRLHCLDGKKSDFFKNIYQIHSYIYMALGVGWRPHICDLPGLHLISVRPCTSLWYYLCTIRGYGISCLL
jgi:hypothetical protein